MLGARHNLLPLGLVFNPATHPPPYVRVLEEEVPGTLKHQISLILVLGRQTANHDSACLLVRTRMGGCMAYRVFDMMGAVFRHIGYTGPSEVDLP